MKTKKLVIFTLIPSIITSLSGCGGNNDNGKKIDNTKTQLSLKFFKGTATQNVKWLDTIINKFESDNAEVSFEDGKKGVQVSYVLERSLPLTTISSDGGDIYLAENSADIYGLAAKGDILDISSVASKYVDRIDADAISRMKGADGKYYAMPSYSWYAGVPYDIDLITANNAFYADSSAASTTFNSSIVSGFSAKFVANKTAKKSVGPDGVANTIDDGLPSSLQELIVWCEYLKKNKSITPFVMGIDAMQYSFFLTHAIWASLAGSDAMRACYTNIPEGGVEVEVVTGYKDNEYFYESSDKKVKIPEVNVETITLTKTNAYKAYSMSARYYSLAFLELANKEGWIELDSNNSTGAQESFIVDGQNAMLYDASYWYHEALINNSLDIWKEEYPEDADNGRNIGFMTMPSQVKGSVTSGNGKKNTLLDLGSSYLFANSHLNNAGNEGVKEAALAFIDCMYSDFGLNTFTSSTGLRIPMSYDYEIDDSNLDNLYYLNEKATIDNSTVVNYSSSNSYFLNNLGAFSLSWQSSMVTFKKDGNTIYDGYLAAYRLYNLSTKDLFEATERSSDVWASIID